MTMACWWISAYLMRRFQSVLTAAAQLIFSLTRSDHITDALVVAVGTGSHTVGYIYSYIGYIYRLYI